MVITEMMTVTKFAFQFPLCISKFYDCTKFHYHQMAGEKVFKFLVSDHLNFWNTIAGQSSTALYATAKTKMYTPVFAKSQTGV